MTTPRSEKRAPENPAPELFVTFERLEVVHRVEVTAENAHLIAQHFGWRVDYANDNVRLITARDDDFPITVGDWVDHRGSRWNPEPLTQGYRPSGTYSEGGVS